MKVGDLVKFKDGHSGSLGIVIEFIQKKCWRTHELGPMIDWRKVDPEPHAVVFFKDMLSIPIVDLEVVHESR
jgi:hypothetical protein